MSSSKHIWGTWDLNFKRFDYMLLLPTCLYCIIVDNENRGVIRFFCVSFQLSICVNLNHAAREEHAKIIEHSIFALVQMVILDKTVQLVSNLFITDFS